MNISIGFSPCPNDTFIFDALIHKKINTHGISYKPYIADVEKLNIKAASGVLDCTKISFHAFAHAFTHYSLLQSGGALGFGNGPVFISKKENIHNISASSRIALPGKNTTAHLLFCIAYPEFRNKIFMLFSDIEAAILNNKVDAGVIIHENRFTYKEKNLECIKDLGLFWEEKTKSPIPLGAIAIKKNIPLTIAMQVQQDIKNSILYAFKHNSASTAFVKNNAQEMSDEIIKKHIALFVNDFSLSFGEEGKKAITKLFSLSAKAGICPNIPDSEIFIKPR